MVVATTTGLISFESVTPYAGSSHRTAEPPPAANLEAVAIGRIVKHELNGQPREGKMPKR